MSQPVITPEEIEDRKTFENAYDFGLTQQDQNVIAFEVLGLVRKLGMSIEDAFYILGKIGLYMVGKGKIK